MDNNRQAQRKSEIFLYFLLGILLISLNVKSDKNEIFVPLFYQENPETYSSEGELRNFLQFQPENGVSLVSILVNPERFDGSVIGTMGYFLVKDDNPKAGHLFLSAQDAKNKNFQNSILVKDFSSFLPEFKSEGLAEPMMVSGKLSLGSGEIVLGNLNLFIKLENYNSRRKNEKN